MLRMLRLPIPRRRHGACPGFSMWIWECGWLKGVRRGVSQRPCGVYRQASSKGREAQQAGLARIARSSRCRRARRGFSRRRPCAAPRFVLSALSSSVDPQARPCRWPRPAYSAPAPARCASSGPSAAESRRRSTGRYAEPGAATPSLASPPLRHCRRGPQTGLCWRVRSPPAWQPAVRRNAGQHAAAAKAKSSGSQSCS